MPISGFSQPTDPISGGVITSAHEILQDADFAALVTQMGLDEAGAATLATTVTGKALAPRSGSGVKAVGQGELLFNVKDYGAVGDATTDDSAAVQAAATAAIAAGGTLYFAPGKYSIHTTITLMPASGTQFQLDMLGSGSYDQIQWNGTAGGSLFYSKGWKRSNVQSVNVRTSVGCVAWDLDGDATYNTLSQIGFHSCNVTTGAAVALIGWRVGHTDTSGADFSFLAFFNCHYSGVNNTTGQIGWLIEGSNSLNNIWFGGSCYKAALAISNQATSGAGSNGNASIFVYGFGTSACMADFNFVTAGSYTIWGGRFELGQRLLNVSLGGSQSGADISMGGGMTVSGYAPTDGIIFNVDGGSTFNLDAVTVRPTTVTGTGTTTSASTSVTGTTAAFVVGQAVYGTGIPAATTITAISSGTLTLSNAATASGTVTLTASTDYTAAMITLTGQSTQRATFSARGCKWQAADPFYTISGSAIWALDVRGCRYIDPSQHTVRFYKTLVNAGGSSDTGDIFNLGNGFGSGTTAYIGLQGGPDSALASSPRGRIGYDSSIPGVVVDSGTTRPVSLRSNGIIAFQTTIDGHAKFLGGEMRHRTVPPSYPYTVLATDQYVAVSTGTAKTINLPAASADAGKAVTIKDVTGGANTNNVTITPNGSDTIDLAASRIISTVFGAVTLVSDGVSNWEVVTSR